MKLIQGNALQLKLFNFRHKVLKYIQLMYQNTKSLSQNEPFSWFLNTHSVK